MFDIDKYLNEMELKDMNIDEQVLTRTKKRCDEEQARAREERESVNKKFKKAMLIAVPAAAILLIGVLAGAWLFPRADAGAAAYYTVDVNPSICVRVDSDGSVTGVVSQNKDAQAIVDRLQVKGDSVTDAIRKILAAIKDAGYFDAGQKYVLIGCFAADGTQLQSTITDLQARLEADFGDMIDLLIVSGSMEDMQQANQLNVSAGLLKLAQLAGGIDITGSDKIEDVLYNIRCVNEENYCAPELTAAVTDKINLSWDEMDFEAMGYAGKVKYYIAAGGTEEEAKSGNASVIKTFSFYTYAEQPLSAGITLNPGVTKYFALYAKYGDVVKCSNVVTATMPGELATPSASPSPMRTEEPVPTGTPLQAHTVTGYVSGDKVKLSWWKETAENFQGYKVVASKTNPSPSYPEDVCIKYITSRSTTSLSVYEGFEGLKADTYYYFSVTYLFNDGSKAAANAIRLKVPPKAETPPSDEYPACNITSASISGDGTVTLHWAKAPDNDFTYYKVVGSFTNDKPKYPDDGYLDCLDRNCTSATYSLSRLSKLGGYAPGKLCYFSITAVYDDGNEKVPGNVKALKMPDTPPVEEPYATTNISATLSEDGTRINFSWAAIDDSRFEGYKVVGSRSHNPSYPGDGYLKYITNKSTHTWSISVANLISEHHYIPGETYYFTITIVYCGDVYKTGADDSVTLPVPDPPSDPPSASPSDPPTEG